MKTRVALLVLGLAACSKPGGDSGANCDLPKSQGVSMPCCTIAGVDACGAGLFCAAFDGRTVATCYAERSRLDMTECNDDQQCVSGQCNPQAQKCRSLFGQSCTVGIGCAVAPDGSRYACDPNSSTRPNTCQLVNGQNGGLCAANSDCQSGRCVLSTCVTGQDGNLCAVAGDCDGGFCVDMMCASGQIGAACATKADCILGVCDIDGVCECSTNSDCSGVQDNPYCVRGACSQGWSGDTCDTDAQCDPQYPHCMMNQCSAGLANGQACADSSLCAKPEAQLSLAKIAVVCDATSHTCAIATGGLCEYSQRCQTGTTCKAAPTLSGKCGSNSGAACSGYYCSNGDTCYDGATCQ